ncbi:hypothetical protein D554_3675 [Bordetella holmesii 30539]|uniref:Plasmid replication/partition related protein n=2 Tax=Bordetella holmesii TaxID=35814 RepID=A0ABN0RZD3_9BORD|nr:hypothetical protein D560_3787 [Bordetella holmesii ATCC 51541]AIT28401.1 hypothetical protein D558_3761 [Bordetella holmesii 44057]AMD47556.1 hypothetical protein F783_000935 [Bordetella holmesii F627]EWM41191.1 hypothetical protein D555_3836 [Bordetella holmesii 35009]EWM41986.1 hypothetical protein D556_3764 [Bordetella holmesii 41130]EWM45082.1 hypothetical protein D557_3071 [Bordetella holmesii 70147]EXF88398.1 hypothetical protein D554_3675 [Bordetella holmesii 30539]EXX94399.1 hypo
MDIEINEELRVYIDPLTSEEYSALERSILAEGCRDALVLWGNVLVDGHNRYEICCRHGVEFRTLQNERFQSMDDVRLWMIDNHLGRRSVSDYQRGVLALRKKQILQAREPSDSGEAAPEAVVPSRQELAREARVSSNTLAQIERIEQQAVPQLVKAVRAGEISINAAAAVASLPPPRQQQAAEGGKQNLREVARQARLELQAARYQAKLRKDAQAQPAGQAEAGTQVVPPWESPAIEDYPAEVERLNDIIKRLTEERDALKKKVMHLTVALAEARREPG